MSLRVWLPLTKDSRNQGLLTLPVPSWDVRSRDTGGKLGQYCYSDNAIYHIENEWLGNEWSLACWVKSSGWSQYNDIILCKNTASSTDAQFYLSIIGGKELNVGCNADSQTLTTDYTFATNTWYHVAATYDGATLKLYLNGNEIGTKAYTSTQKTSMNNLGIGCRSTNAAGTSATGGSGKRMNDIRIYDHALSPLEVKEISKGLILHYPLSDNSIQSLNNCYAYPRFETSSSNGGWSHWGSSGHAGTYGQTTDTNYIFRKGQTYAHWVADGSSTTKDYLLYQEPAFDGGLRSLVAICKEENSKPITNNICYATWNARSGGAVNNSWTSIHSLGNGFYLCKCEGISQDGSNDLVGIYIKPGYKVYFSEVYLENYKSVCSDIFFSSTVIYDTSGYGNNGTPIGSFSVDKNTPKYNVSTVFNGVDNAIQTPSLPSMISDKNYTIAVWIYKTVIGSKGYQTIYGGPSGFEIEARNGGANETKFVPWNWGKPMASYELNEWNHCVFVHSDSDCKIYLNGEYVATGTAKASNPSGNYFVGAWSTATQQNFEGLMSDFRIYATALSADDVKSLYNNSAYIDNHGNVYGAVYEEV